MAKRSRSKRRRGGGNSNEPLNEEETGSSGNHDLDHLEETGDAVDDNAPEADDANGSQTQRQQPPAASTSEETWNAARSHLLDNLLPFVSSGSTPEEKMLASLMLLLTNGDEDGDDSAGAKKRESRRKLVTTSDRLFRYIEHLASMEDQLKEKMLQRRRQQMGLEEEEFGGEEKKTDDCDDEEEPCTLSGLPSLYTGEEEGAGPGMEEAALDAETIWGQVELQNDALMPRLKKLIKKLGKRATNEGGKYGEDEMVRVLETPGMMDGDENEHGSDGGESDDEDDVNEGSAASNLEGGGNGSSDDDDPGARRIRERMEAAMADMSDNEENEDATNRPKEEEAVEGIDLAREDMRDGFFDLHEMEAFADEEEEMLPQDAYGEESTPADEEGNGDSDADGDDDDPLTKRFRSAAVRRKKYRADDEVEALYQLYDDDGQNDDKRFGSDSDEEKDGMDPMWMTAADLFGKPDEKVIHSYKTKMQSKNGKKKKGGAKEAMIGNDDGDDDSWDNHDFEEDAMEWKERRVNGGEGGSDGEEDRTDDNDKDDEEGDNGDNHDTIILTHDNKKQSSHAIQSQKLQEQTLALEKDLLAEKPWAMMGEAKGTDRAFDSLLGGGDDGPTPEFAVAFKPPPVLTPEHTATIEEMIKKRIVDEDWDDVVPRELPDIGRHKRGGDDAPEVSQEKSKLGLGELYEREYLKKTTGYDRTADEKRTTEDAAKEEMNHLFVDLCSQLDALSNYQFAPRPVADEADVDVQNNKDSVIAMEEVLPLHVGQGRGVSPEEVFGGGESGTGKGAGKKGSVLKGESEMDQAERKRLRSARKVARRKARKQKHADEKLISKLQPGLGLNNPYEKRKLREELQMARSSGRVAEGLDDEAAVGKEYRTSTKFFQKMQENVDGMLHSDGGDGGGRAKKKRRGVDKAGQGSSVYKL